MEVHALVPGEVSQCGIDGEAVVLAAEIDVEVFELGGEVRRDLGFGADADGVAAVVIAVEAEKVVDAPAAVGKCKFELTCP